MTTTTQTDFYEYATMRLLRPETYTEPSIIPYQLMVHTHGFEGSSEAVGDYFDRDSINVESHTSTKLNGTMLQFQDLLRQADAQGFANGFRLPNKPGKLYGAISMEHEEDGSGYFTPAQIATDGLFMARMVKKYPWIPLAICPTITSPGVSWHRRFDKNNPNKHKCPSDQQIKQIPEIMNVARWFLLQDKPRNTDIVGRLKQGDSRWALQRDGGVITEAGTKFYGSYPGLPPQKRQGDRYFTQILSRGDGVPGYVLVSNRGEFYVFPG